MSYRLDAINSSPHLSILSQTMDRTHSLTIDLEDHTAKLTKLLENFKEIPCVVEHDIAGHIDILHK